MAALGKAIAKGYKATHDGVTKLYRKVTNEFDMISNELIASGDEVGEFTVKVAEDVVSATLSRLENAVQAGVRNNINNAVDTGEFFAETVEEAAEEIVDTAVKQNKIFSWDEVKAFFKRGNDFNDKAVTDGWYDYHEVHLANGKRLDSYDPDLGEIVSRKATDLGNIKFSTFENYLKEMHQKYPAGTQIRSNKYLEELDGQLLQGQQILEIPVSNQSLPNIQTFIKFARDNYSIKIRFRPE